MSVSRPLPGRVWIRRATLDRMLARGANPHNSPDVARRAAQLTSARHRRSPAVPVERREVLAARASLVRLAKDLAGADREVISGVRRAVSTRHTNGDSLDNMPSERYLPRGVALVQLLLTDGESPLCAPHPAGELELR